MSGNNRNDNMAGEGSSDQHRGPNSNNGEASNNNLDLRAGDYGELGLNFPIQGFNDYLSILDQGGAYDPNLLGRAGGIDLGLAGQGQGENAGQIRNQEPAGGYPHYFNPFHQAGGIDLGLVDRVQADNAAQIRNQEPVGGYPNLHVEGAGQDDFLDNLDQVENADDGFDFGIWLHDVDEIAGENGRNHEPNEMEAVNAEVMRDQVANVDGNDPNDDGNDPNVMDIDDAEAMRDQGANADCNDQNDDGPDPNAVDIDNAEAMRHQGANDEGNEPNELNVDDAEAVPNQSAPRTQRKRKRSNAAKDNVFVPPPPMEITAETKARSVAAHWSGDRIPALKTISKDTEEMGEKKAKRWPETRPFNGTPIFSRSGYVRALLIQTYADVTSKPCDHCRSNMGRFTQCVRDPLMGGGGCASCLWSSRHKKCNYHKDHPNTWHAGIPDVVEAAVKGEVPDMEETLSDMLHASKDNDDKEEMNLKLSQLRNSRELLESCYNSCKEFLRRKNTENPDNPEDPENPDNPE